MLNVRTGVAACAVLLLAGCASGGPVEHWQPYSNSAMYITGDVRFSPHRIVFENGSRLPLAFLRQQDIDTESGPRLADLYRVTSPRPLRLMRRNIFCDPAAAYLAVIRDGGRPGTAIAGDRNDRRLYVYFDDPQAKPSPLCAIYNYEYLPQG